MRTLLLIILLQITTYSWGKLHDILPRPKHIERIAGKGFALNRPFVVEDPTHTLALQDFVRPYQAHPVSRARASIRVMLTDSLPHVYHPHLYGYDNEAYELTVLPEHITIRATSPTGVLRAAQTLSQLAEGSTTPTVLEAVHIVDYPSFSVRGFMHDTGRSFISVNELKRELRLLAHFKVNTFHWHLTENQAWRFEVNAYPQLTAASSMTRDAGKYYTQAQCREVEAYARQHGIIVIPEIDMPGHSAAFERAMGHSMQTEVGVKELKVILNEVAAAFPLAPYIHIGGDEKPITYPDFLSLMTDHVRQLGKKVIVWVPNHAHFAGADMAQLWSSAGTLVPGIPNIDCRYNYINHFDVFADVIGIYKSNIYHRQQGDSDVAGEICALWNDHKLKDEQAIIRQNNFYANVIASASRAWQGRGKQYIEQGGVMLPEQGEEHDDFCDWERRFLFHKAHCLRHEPIPYVKQTHVRWGVTTQLDGRGRPTNPHYATGAAIYLQHTWRKVVPALLDNAADDDTAYVWTSVYSPRAQQVGALIELQNYSRSEQDKSPEIGSWDRKGSVIRLNGHIVEAPAWQHHGERRLNEMELTDENLTGRPPLHLQLKAGWNEVLLIIPHRKPDGIRLNKWMFTFVLTDLEGRNAADGLRYDPHRPVIFPTRPAHAIKSATH